MNSGPKQITLKEWDTRYKELCDSGMEEPFYGGPLSRHVEDGDLRLNELLYDNSAASLRLWNFLLTEEERLKHARAQGKKIVGAMKDLGTVPVMAYSLDNTVAFYIDGAWWIPCVMELSAGLLQIADSLGIDESFCPVRALLGAFLTEAHFPIPDLIICSTGAVCDDLSAIAQRLNGLGYPILWWEMVHRRYPDVDETAVDLPGGFTAPDIQVSFVREELERVKNALENQAGARLDDESLAKGISKANEVRRLLSELRFLTFTAEACPLPALEMLIAEMLTIHFCSDQDETIIVLEDLVDEVKERIKQGTGVMPKDAVPLFWVNPVADLKVMNLLEECGGRICGTEYLFSHALDEIPEDIPPMEALAQTALADPMVGPVSDRGERICSDIKKFGAKGVVISRIPGASHCAAEGVILSDIIRNKVGIPVIEIEVPPVSDSMKINLRTRLEALIESVTRSVT
ncbi:2-hydroxyacyl-CoA dehydratase subunit D [Planctomycetota bacterium]